MRRPPDVGIDLEDRPAVADDRAPVAAATFQPMLDAELIEPETARSSAVTPLSGVNSTLPEIDSARWSPEGSSSPTIAILPLVDDRAVP